MGTFHTLMSSSESILKTIYILSLLAVFAISPLAAQQHSASGAQNTRPHSAKGGVPVSSPEPITMIALAGGAAAAGGLASRRRKKSQ
ncbi:MAG: PEP-CTERM sorting domain-containing protein [Planctomycetota bacterium]